MTKIAGRYEIKAKLGEGGMGVVYRAYDPPPMDREVAVKTLHAFEDPLALELFYKEGTALKMLSHPNIVEIFDMGVSEIDGHQQPFFVMPLLLGQTLDELIRKASHRLTVDRVVEIFMQTCRGLQAAHERGLVHRDLKPSNIFVMTDDSVKIIDFGVAQAAHAKSRTTGYDKGTLLYMSPEQVQHKPVSVQSDIYALGVTLYEALTRRQPFRKATEDAVIQAILTHIPPSATEINPAVSHTLSRVVHKAMAKQPWNRFDSARDFSETLQKAHRNEPIAIFDPARIQPRLQTATKALEKGDYQFAGEIISELEAEGNIDPQITLLRAEIDQSARKKTVAQLLESARARYEEEEDPLALQKLQEVLQMDPTNVIALGLKSKIEDRRSERQIEKWIQLAQQHASNRAYSYAREALQNALTLRPKDPRASRLLKEIEGDEQEYMRLRHEKAELYQAAVNAWKNGEVSQALSQMRVVLDLDRRAPDVSSPDAASTYQTFFNKIRSEHEAINTGYAEARRLLADREYDKALAICQTFLEKYPGQALFRAVKFDVDEQQRQRLSAFIAETDRRLQAEADLDARVHLVREAAAEFPAEDHFKRLVRLLEDKRDLVNSIVERAKLHESSGQIAEAVSDLETLRTIYGGYPGLKFEQERLQKRLEQQTRDVARTKWVRQIDAQLHTGDYARANDLLDKADAEFPGDPELAELRKLASQGVERSIRADQLVAEGQDLCEQGHLHEGVALLKAALQLDDRSVVRMKLRDLLVARAQEIHAADWRGAEGLVEEALELDPNHALARSLRSQVLHQRREEEVGQFASQARRLQADGEIEAAMAEVEKGLASYPTDTRLSAIKDALNKETVRTAPPSAQEAPTMSSGALSTAPGRPVASVEPAEAVDKTQIVPVRASAEASDAALDGKTEIIPRGGRGEQPAARKTERPAIAASVPAKPAPAGPKWLWPAVAGAGVLIVVVGVIAWSRYGDDRTNEAQTIAKGPEQTPGLNPVPPPPEPQSTPGTSLPPESGVTPTPTPSATLTPGPATPAPKPTTSPSSEVTPPTASSFATLNLIGFPAGTQVLFFPEGTPTLSPSRRETVGADGSFSRNDIEPRNYDIQLERRGFDPVRSGRRVLAVGATVTIPASEFSWLTTVHFKAPAGTTVSIMPIDKKSKDIETFLTEKNVKLKEGSYDVVSKGTSNVEWTDRFRVTADGPRSHDVRVVGGMEGFTGFTPPGEGKYWFERRTAGPVMYEIRRSTGRFMFAVRLGGNSPISDNTRLDLVIGNIDNKNYLLLGLDKQRIYRTIVRNGKETPLTNSQHTIPFNRKDLINLDVLVYDDRVVLRYEAEKDRWEKVDDWRPDPALPEAFSNGKFGFNLPGRGKVLAIPYFRHFPDIR